MKTQFLKLYLLKLHSQTGPKTKRANFGLKGKKIKINKITFTSKQSLIFFLLSQHKYKTYSDDSSTTGVSDAGLKKYKISLKKEMNSIFLKTGLTRLVEESSLQNLTS